MLQNTVHIIRPEHYECRKTEANTGPSSHWRQGLYVCSALAFSVFCINSVGADRLITGTGQKTIRHHFDEEKYPCNYFAQFQKQCFALTLLAWSSGL